MEFDDEAGLWYRCDGDARQYRIDHQQFSYDICTHTYGLLMDVAESEQKDSLTIHVITKERRLRNTISPQGLLGDVRVQDDAMTCTRRFLSNVHLHSTFHDSASIVRPMLSQSIQQTWAIPRMTASLAVCSNHMAKLAREAGKDAVLTVKIYITVTHTEEDGREAMGMTLVESFELDNRRESSAVPASAASVGRLERIEYEEGRRDLDRGKCVICQYEFIAGIAVLRMPCKHIFHGECIVDWLKQAHACPVCRFEI